MPFTPKDWKDLPDETTPITAEALEDLEERVTDYADSVAGGTELDDHIADTSDAHDASAISFSPDAGIAATDVQAAIVEDAGDLASHLTDSSDAHDASAISIVDTGGDFTATDVEGALAELQADHEADETALSNHISDSADAHAGTAITNTAAGNISATTVQGAINELDTEKASVVSLNTHIADGTAAHGASAISNVPSGNITSTDVQGAINELDAKGISPNSQTSNYTLLLTDAGKAVEMANASARTVTVPPNSSVAFPVGAVLEVCRMGTGAVTIASGVGVTIRSTNNRLSISGQYGAVSLRKRATDEWVLNGSLE